MDWNEEAGRVSFPFEQWKNVYRDVHTFMDLTLRAVASEYARLQEEAQQIAWSSDEVDGDVDEAFHRLVEGLWPPDHEWMLLSAVVKDAVTSYEVYLEDVLREVVREYGLTPAGRPGWSLKFSRMKAIYKVDLGIDIEPDEVRTIRDMRHILSHLRGRLRTEEQRKKFAAEEELGRPLPKVGLTQASVEGVLRDLDRSVRRIDPVMWGHSAGVVGSPSLLAVAEAIRNAQAEDSPTSVDPEAPVPG